MSKDRKYRKKLKKQRDKKIKVANEMEGDQFYKRVQLAAQEFMKEIFNGEE